MYIKFIIVHILYILLIKNCFPVPDNRQKEVIVRVVPSITGKLKVFSILFIY